ncbi:MAG: hypothetical protein JRJ19_09005 [Deltaproteobacteria bacterium]|nr:hypothetical protein [Deltaproteobacteria bacterium]MBW1872190.1 hypothetical protein [Deltaproteobacteria bacterium]
MEETTDNPVNQANSEAEADSLQQLDPITQARLQIVKTMKTGDFRLAGDEIEELSKDLEGKDLESVRLLSQRLEPDPVAIIIGIVCLIGLLVVAALYVFH